MSRLQNNNSKLEKAASIKKAYDVLDELLKECKTPDEIVGQNGLLKELSKALIERAMLHLAPSDTLLLHVHFYILKPFL